MQWVMLLDAFYYMYISLELSLVSEAKYLVDVTSCIKTRKYMQGGTDIKETFNPFGK